MSFLSDCDAIPELVGASKPGLQALNARDAAHIHKQPDSVLTTSIDIDSALQPSQPNAARWDYGVGERRNQREIVHWIEVHLASGGANITQMEHKLRWLRGWLHGKALADRERQVVWVASGKSAFNARDPRLKALALSGLRFAGGHFAI
jgi:hypothetical protein